MSAFGDALKAVREVILLSARVESLDQRIDSVASDMDGLADMVASLRDRVARMEGFIEGAAAASSASTRKKLPRD